MLATEIILGSSKHEELYYKQMIHSKNKGFITVAEKELEEFKQWHYKYSSLPSLVGKMDNYMSMNTFWKTYRRIEYLKELTTIFVDIDYYNTNFSKETVLHNLTQLVEDKKLPQPSITIDSGRGLYVIWKIEQVPNQALALWQTVENHFVDLLFKYGADPLAKDACRVLRVPGTVNSKNNSSVDMLEFIPELVYTLRALQEEYLPTLKVLTDEEVQENEKGVKKRSPNSNKLVRLFNIYNLNYTRIVDLITLCELRSFDLPSRRELVLFLYRLWSNLFCENKEIALERTLELNTQFLYPLSVREATSATRSAEKAFDAWESGETVQWQGREVRKGYNYTNKTLIDILDITQEEQIHMKTIIGTTEKYRRNNEKRTRKNRNENGLTSREQAKQDMLSNIKRLKADGYKQSQIAQELSISRGRVSQYIKEFMI